ncbi:MAG: hypothetical protein P8P99_08490 [Maricaulis sp.]|nr:hypothetical protein [Maricaulis sp.]
MWVGVRERFRQFRNTLKLTDDQLIDGTNKQLGVRQSLQRAYYGATTDTPPGFLVGSWGKGTATQPVTDIDIFFVIPLAVYHRVEAYSGNKQSALLQEVKNHLLNTYPQTNMRGDGQVVLVGFKTIIIEVVPVVVTTSPNCYLMPDTNAGGRWKPVTPQADVDHLNATDAACGANVRPLIGMLKAWKRECNVPLKSFQIELLVSEFLSTYQWRTYDYYFYDWFIRDFFQFLCVKQHGYVYVPSTGDIVDLGDAWHSRAISARDRALKACEAEYDDLTIEAGEEWQKIFGQQIPIYL